MLEERILGFPMESGEDDSLGLCLFASGNLEEWEVAIKNRTTNVEDVELTPTLTPEFIYRRSKHRILLLEAINVNENVAQPSIDKDSLLS